MVGVPGRSRACLTCKKRRIACDLQRPDCQRCVRAQRKCEYAQDRIFVLNDEGTHKTVYRKADGETRNSGKVESGSSSSASPENYGLSPTQERANAFITTASPGFLSLIKAPGDAVFLRQALIGHALTRGKEDILAHADSRPETFSGVFATALTSGILSNLESPLLACYTSWVGRMQQNERLIDASHEFYIRGLHETHKALSNPKTLFDNSTLAACNSLAIYEALECPGGNMSAYHWHRTASYRLIRQRGPHAFKDGPGHYIFTNFRMFGVLHAFDNGIATYLATPEWMTIPWSVNPKTSSDELIDILALGPGVIAIAKRIEGMSPEKMLYAGLDIMTRLNDIIIKQEQFYTRYEQNHPSFPIFWEQISPTRADSPTNRCHDADLVFPPTLCFPDLRTAAILTLFWAMQALAWAGLADLYPLFQQAGMAGLLDSAISTNSPHTPQSLQFLWLDRARKVFQSVTYCTTAQALENGPPVVATQLAIATDITRSRQGCEAEYEWGVKARRRMGEKWLQIFKVGYEEWEDSRGPDVMAEVHSKATAV